MVSLSFLSTMIAVRGFLLDSFSLISFDIFHRFAIILFISGVLNLPSMNYYKSEGKGYFNSLDDVPKMYRGSAICANVTWVTCSDCDVTHFGADRVRVNDSTGQNEFLKNDCYFDGIFHGIFDSLRYDIFKFSLMHMTNSII